MRLSIGTATMYWMQWSRSAGLLRGPFLSMMRMQASCVRIVIFLMSPAAQLLRDPVFGAWRYVRRLWPSTQACEIAFTTWS